MKPPYDVDDRVPITEQEYIDYLIKNFPQTDRYIQYSGNSVDQVKAFQAAHPGEYFYYDDFYANTPEKPNPTYAAAFDETLRMPDGDASSSAMSKVATGHLIVFGAVEYQKFGENSFYGTKEAPFNKERLASGELKSIDHMVKGALQPDEVLATENSVGELSFQSGYTEDTTNASDPPTAGSVCPRSPATPNTSRPGSNRGRPGSHPGDDTSFESTLGC